MAWGKPRQREASRGSMGQAERCIQAAVAQGSLCQRRAGLAGAGQIGTMRGRPRRRRHGMGQAEAADVGGWCGMKQHGAADIKQRVQGRGRSVNGTRRLARGDRCGGNERGRLMRLRRAARIGGRGRPHAWVAGAGDTPRWRWWVADVSFSCVVKTQRRWSNKIYKTELTKTRYNNQVLGKYRVDRERGGLTLIAELTWSNLGLKGFLNKRK